MKKSLWLYFSSEVFLSLGLGATTYAQPFFYKAAGLSDGTIGALFAVNSITGGVSALIMGSVADRIGASKVFKLATLLLGIIYLLIGLNHSLPTWFILSALGGMAGSLLMTTENVVLSSLTQGREMAGVLSKFVALYMFVMGIGAVLAGPISAHYSYQTAMMVGACIALMAPLLRFFVKAPDAKSSHMFRLPSRRLVAMSVYAGIFGVAMGIFNPFANLVLQSRFALSDNVTSLISAASTFMVSFGALTVSGLLRHLKQGRTLLLTFAASAACCVCMAWTHSPAWFTGFYLFRTITMSVPGSIVDAMFLNLSHETEYAQMFGTRVFGNSVGMASGQYAGGTLLNHHLLTGILVLSATFVVLAYAYLWVVVARIRDTQAGVDQSTSLSG